MRRFTMGIVTLFVVGLVVACGARMVVLPPGVSNRIALLPLGADTAGLDADQTTYLQDTLQWMDGNLLQSLNRRGFTAVRIYNEKEFTRTGHLLKYAVTKHKMIPKGARFWVGRMAGADLLDVHYDLIDASGKTVLSWDDGKSSTTSGTSCAQALNSNAVRKISVFLSKN